MRVTIKRVDVIPLRMVYLLLKESLWNCCNQKTICGLTSDWGVKRFPLLKGAVDPGVSCRVCSQRQPSHFQPGGKRKHQPDCRIISPLWFRVQRNETGSWRFLQTTNDWQTADGVSNPLVSDQRLISVFWPVLAVRRWSGVSSSGHLCSPHPWDWAKKMNLACHGLISLPDTLNFVANLPSLLPDVVTCRQMFIILNS